MRLKVMISSVRRGLAQERDSLRPVMEILGYDPIRFEDFTPASVPSRAVCIDAVDRCDIYLLLLGELYGDPMPDTGLAPTAEEWKVARGHGKPVVTFKKTGVTAEPRQAEFIGEVEAYSTGIFRGTFTDTADLLGKLKEPLAAAAATLQPMRARRLTESVAVPWRGEDRLYGGTLGVVLETHVVPIGTVDPLRAASFPELTRRLARAGRDSALFDEGEALNFPVTETSVAAEARADGRRREAGLSVTTDRSVTVWEALPSQIGGAIFDEAQIRTRIARDLRLGGGLEVLTSSEATVAIGLNRVNMLGRATGPNSMTYPFVGTSQGPLHLEPIDAIPIGALARIADEVAAELVSRLVLRLNSRR
jgi:hypothetical protein